jgi:hypothetical protein
VGHLPVAPNRFPLGNSHIPATNCASPPQNKHIPTMTFGVVILATFVLYSDRVSAVVAKARSPLKGVSVAIMDVSNDDSSIQGVWTGDLRVILGRVDLGFRACRVMGNWKYRSFVVLKCCGGHGCHVHLEGMSIENRRRRVGWYDCVSMLIYLCSLEVPLPAEKRDMNISPARHFDPRELLGTTGVDLRVSCTSEL